MADVTVDITIGLVSYKTWLTTSYIATAIVGESGMPLIVVNEMGPDQEDAFAVFMDEAAIEVLKLFTSRQGNVSGTPYTKNATNVIYLFKEETPVLPQAASIKAVLNEDVKNALFAYVTFLWLKMKKNNDQAEFIYARYQQLTDSILGNIHRLHD